MAYSELLKVGNSYNMPVKQYYCDSEATMNALPQTIPAGSTCLVPDGKTGVKNFIFCKTSDTEGYWVAI